MQLNLFNGGLNLRGSPFLISQNQSVECENIDFAKGSLYPRNKNLVLEQNVKPYIYKFKGNWIQSDKPRDYIEYQNKLYYTEADSKPQKSTDGINFYNLGIDKPDYDLNWEAQILSECPVKLDLFYCDKPWLSERPDTGSFKLYSSYGDNRDLFIDSDLDSSFIKSVYGTNDSTFNTAYFGYSKLSKRSPLYVNYWTVGESIGTYRSDYSTVIQISSQGMSEIKPAVFQETYASDFDTITSKALIFTQDMVTSGKLTTKSTVKLSVDNGKLKAEATPNQVEDLTDLSFKDIVNFIDSTTDIQIITKHKTSEELKIYKQKFSSQLLFDKVLMGVKISSDENFNLDDYDIFIFKDFEESSNPFKLTKDPSGLDSGLYWLNFEFDDTVVYKDLVGFYNFCYTYYNEIDGTESPPSSYFYIPVYELNTISWNTKVSDKQITHVRIYCIGKNNTNMTLLAEIPVNYGSYTFASSAVQNMIGSVLASELYYPAPTNLQYLVESNGILYGAEGYTMYFSNEGNANYWNPFNTITFERKITGLAKVYQGLLVFLIDKTYLVTGSDISDLQSTLLSSSVGCLDHRSIQYSNSKVLWASYDGICSCKGGSISNLSMANLGTFNITETIRFSAYHNDIYYLALPSRVFIMDLRFEVLFEWLSDNMMSYFRDPETDILYGVDFYNNFVKVGASEELHKVKFLSPKYSDGSISTLKSYKDLYAYTEGNINLTIYMDDKEILKVDLNNGFTDIKIPQPYTQGYYLQFLVEGQGVLHELSYTFEGRQNGR